MTIRGESVGDDALRGPHFDHYSLVLYRLVLPTPAPATPKQPPFDMRGPRFLLLAKSFFIDAASLFSWRFSQSENNPSLPSLSPPPVSVTDNGLPHKHYSEVVQQLRPPPPPNCASFEANEVKAVSDIPIEAGGYADVWEATLYDRNVIQKSYRCYETGDVESIFRVRNNVSSCDVLFTLCSRDIVERFRHAVGSPTRTSFRLLESPPCQTILSLSFSTPLVISDSENT